MATTGIVNGTLIGLYKKVAGTPDVITKFANGTSNNFNIDRDMIEVSNKDSGAAKEYIYGSYGFTFDFEGFLEEDGSVGAGSESAKDIIGNIVNGDTIIIQMKTASTGDMVLEGTCLISNVSLGAPYNDASTFSATLQGTGALTVTTA